MCGMIIRSFWVQTASAMPLLPIAAMAALLSSLTLERQPRFLLFLKAFIGGAIGPGIIVSTDALVEKAALLHKVEYIKPEHAICTNTKDSIQSGIINGYVGFVENIVRQMEKELSAPPTVVATGGMSSMIAAETDSIDVLHPTLTLEGLNYIYLMNQ